jgi:hypothetical protein
MGYKGALEHFPFTLSQGVGTARRAVRGGLGETAATQCDNLDGKHIEIQLRDEGILLPTGSECFRLLQF